MTIEALEQAKSLQNKIQTYEAQLQNLLRFEDSPVHNGVTIILGGAHVTIYPDTKVISELYCNEVERLTEEVHFLKSQIEAL